MSNNVPNTWPPDEPIVPAVIVARLDRLGWTPDTYRLESFNPRRALVRVRATTAEPYRIIDLTDGHEIAPYATLDGARAAFILLAVRDAEEDEGGESE